MPRGVMTVAESREEAEQDVLASSPEIRVLRSREIDLSGLPPIAGKPLPRHWVVVVEHSDPEKEAQLPQHDDPEDDCERETRRMYLAMAVDPQLLVTGVIEQFGCPACGEEVQIELPAPRERRDPGHADCPRCRKHLRRDRKGNWAIFQPPPKPRRTCTFCGAKADSKEHVIPAWISKRLGIREFLFADDPAESGEVGRRSQPISFANYRARIFCVGCNRHFKHLEDSVIPVLEPMARGQSLSLGSESQGLVALWAVKTACSLIAATPEIRDDVPEPHRRMVRERGLVPAETAVAFFAWRGDPVISVRAGAIDSLRSPGRDRRGYSASLAFGRVGFAVAGFDPALDEEESPHVTGALFRQFWPPRERFVHWPPPIAGDEGHVPYLHAWLPSTEAV